MAAHPHNLIITGMPRGGTTLLTAMIDSLPDAVALNEPMWQYHWMIGNREKSTREDFVKWLVGDFISLRHRLIQQIPVPEKRAAGGAAVTNYLRSDQHSSDVQKIVEVQPFTRAGLTENMLLGIKQTGPYLSVLKELSECEFFKVVAVIRHPVGVISSWREVPIALREGKMPGAMAYWKRMIELTGEEMDVLERQVKIYDLICERLHSLRDRIILVKYEDIALNPVLVYERLGVDVPAGAPRVVPRENAFYDGRQDVERIAQAVRMFGYYYKTFYEV